MIENSRNCQNQFFAENIISMACELHSEERTDGAENGHNSMEYIQF